MFHVLISINSWNLAEVWETWSESESGPVLTNERPERWTCDQSQVSKFLRE